LPEGSDIGTLSGNPVSAGSRRILDGITPAGEEARPNGEKHLVA
jgi:hypothetical protein